MTRFAAYLTLALNFFIVEPALANETRGPGPAHIRSDHHDLLDAVEAGSRSSATFERLVQRLGASDVIVYLVYDFAPLPGVAARISFLSTAGGWRYLRVSIDPKYTGCQRLALLGHEFEHAVEIAEAAAVVDASSLAALYRQIGFRSGADHEDRFDTLDAIRAGWQIQLEAGRQPPSRLSGVTRPE